MINLSLKDIRNSSNDLSFKRGVKYYQNGHVKNITTNANTLISTVLGNNLYSVVIKFDPHSGNLSSVQCNCETYSHYSGACKHIVATLFEILYTKEKINLTIDKLSHKKIISDFSNILMDDLSKQIKQIVDIEVIIEPLKESYCTTSLRIGIDKFYLIKDFTKLLAAIKTNTTLYFGRSFTFNPKLHEFSSFSQDIIDIIEDYYDTYNFFKPNFHEENNIQLHNNFNFPSNIMKKLLRLVRKNTFLLKYRGVTFTSNIISGLPRIDFKITQDKNEIKVALNKPYVFFSITKDNEYVFFEGDIYYLNKNNRQFFKLILDHFKNSQKGMVIDKEYKQDFVITVFPVLKSFGLVEMNEMMTSNLHHEDLVTLIYLDKYKKTIKGSLSFLYGDYKIDIYPPGIPEKLNDIIIVRDIGKESEILKILANASCTLDETNSFFTILDENKLYDFIHTHLPILQEKAEVYYSSDFNDIQIKVPSNIHLQVNLNDSSNMLEFSFNIENIEIQELPQILQSIQEKKKYYRLKDGSFLKLEQSLELINFAKVIKEFNLKSKDLTKEVIQIPKYRGLYLDHLLQENNLPLYNKNDSFKMLIEDIKSPENIEFKIPDSLESTLRYYQKKGVQWLNTISYYGFGGILADDMGLGKTLQAITLLKSLDPSKQSLVVAPTSLIYNWEEEFEKFAPDLKVIVITGEKKVRYQILENIKDYQILITSYGLLKRDIHIYSKLNFKYSFIDEAQHIKNPNSLNAKSVKLINAETRFALTGTPIENSLSELWSIFDYIMPGYLYSHSKFINTYERPIIKNGDKHALEKLNEQIKPFILRRLKTDVLKELPPKIETKMITELSTKQKKLYLAYLDRIKGELKNDIYSKNYNISPLKILAALTRLRQICCHPLLFAENYLGGSSKLDLLEELVIDGTCSGHRILIFSQFTGMLKIIKSMLDKNKLSYFYLDGSTKPDDRQSMVNEFNSGINEIFLISLKAGGTGLNLTGADMVIHYDPWWNPATEDQATDRAYRIGQDKSVQVIRLITAGTIEEKIYMLQQKKKSLIDSVIQPGETLINKLTEKEIMEILEVK